MTKHHSHVAQIGFNYAPGKNSAEARYEAGDPVDTSGWPRKVVDQLEIDVVLVRVKNHKAAA